LRKFKIKVNGEIYEVEVEEIGGNPGCYAAPAPTPAPAAALPPTPVDATPAPAPAASPGFVAPAHKPAVPAAGGGAGAICAPMPGIILDIKVNVGDVVNVGDFLLILEAMKMENELTADRVGTVKEIKVTKGQSVNGGDPLVVIG